MSSSFSMDKLKNLLPTKTMYVASPNDNINKNSGRQLEPEVGFKLILDSGKAKSSKEKDRPPELLVHLIGARHLPTSFGFKSVQGYQIKVKLFPGSTKFDSNIQKSSWPKFDQTFKFSLIKPHTSSMKQKKKVTPMDNSETLPEKLFKGNFIVFTVFALLELPPGSTSAIKEAFGAFKRQGSLLLRQHPNSLVKGNSTEDDEQKLKNEEMKTNKSENEKKDVKPKSTVLTTSESQRNLGSVTWFFEPKLFVEDVKTGLFNVEEMWRPIKELTVNHLTESKVSVQSSVKGQLELTLELVECEPPITPIQTPNDVPGNPFEEEEEVFAKTSGKSRTFSFKGMKSMMKISRKDKKKSLCFKITISRMRCSVKAKEGFEQKTSEMYIKTSVFQRDMHVKSWKSDNFLPTLSCRWDPNQACICVPLNDESDLEHTNVRVSIATKNKMGKKIVFGEINLGPTGKGTLLEHWSNMISGKGSSVTMWHNFE